MNARTQIKRNGAEWQITTELHNVSKTPALMVRVKAVRSKSGDLIVPALYSDNYVALMPGEKRTISISLTMPIRGERNRHSAGWLQPRPALERVTRSKFANHLGRIAMLAVYGFVHGAHVIRGDFAGERVESLRDLRPATKCDHCAPAEQPGKAGSNVDHPAAQPARTPGWDRRLSWRQSCRPGAR